jgi:hypothetical protein
MRTKKEKSEIPSDKLELYERLIETNRNIERKGVGLPYTSVNGHMFTFLTASGSLAIRLPQSEREAFIRKYNSALFEAHGVILKEYVAVPDQLLKNTGELTKYLDLSFQYAMTLKPKTPKKSASVRVKGKKATAKSPSRRAKS